MNNYLGEIIKGKVIPKSYGHISHLPGSKMIDDRDKLIGEQEMNWLLNGRPSRTSSGKPRKDIIYISEKIDGCNCAVYRKDGKLYPLTRRGYDVRTNPMKWIQSFADYVDDNAWRFMQLLQDGEMACGDWMIKTHTIQYMLQVDPFIIFDIIDDGKNQRESYKNIENRCMDANGIPTVTIWHDVGPILPQDALRIISSGGYCGARTLDGIPEGVVYRLECDDKFVCSGKFVYHPDVGNQTLFHANDKVFNIVRDQDRKYLKL